MNLKNFEAIIKQSVIDRGYEIYDEYLWSNFTSKLPHYSIVIKGSTNIYTKAEIDDFGQIITHDCTCKEKKEHYCKHLVALLYVVQDEFDLIQYNKPIVINKNELEKLSKDQLIELISNIAEEHKPVYDLLKLYLGTKTERLEWARSLCEANLNFVLDDEFSSDISLDEVNFDGIINVLNAAQKEVLLDVAVEMALIPLYEILEFDRDDEEVMEMLESMMDYVESTLMMIIDQKLKEAPYQERQNAFEHMITLAQQYWEELIENELFMFFNYVVELADESNHEQFEHLIIFIIQACKKDEHVYHYAHMLHHANIIYYTYLAKFGTLEQQSEFIQQNKDNHGLLVIAYDKFVEQEKFKEALDLILYALEQDEVVNFLTLKELELNVRVKLGHIKDVIEILKQFILIGDVRFVDDYLAYFDDQNKDKAIEELITMMKENNIIDERFEDLLIETNRLDELLEYCINDPKSIIRLHRYLKDTYNEQANACFEQFIIESIENAKNKKQYRDIVKYLKGYMDYSVEDAQKFMLKVFQEYKARKVFIEILSKSFDTK